MINSSLIFNDILENLGLSSIASLIGISIVFLVLALIIGSIMLLNFVLSTLESRKNKTKETKVQVSEKKEPEIIIENATQEDKKRIVAVITATIMVSAFDKPNVRFIVRKIRKI